ncbi:MAG: DEAD/DEAH box helicase [Bacteroidaceae bacterium]|nr:DEAD/DEAH box helicase [Bacteroidaceae bacterium]
MQRIVLIQPLKYWEMNGATVYNVREEGSTLTLCGRPAVESLTEDEDKVRFLLRVCDSMDETSLYEGLGKRSFRKAETFWNEADITLKSHVQRVVAVRLADALDRARQLGIKVYYRGKRNDDIIADNYITDSDGVVRPILSFDKDGDNIIYTLKLMMNAKEVIPCSHAINIFANNPSLFTIDNVLYRLPDGMSAKLLVPFLLKKCIIIPVKMQNEYIKKFILKNASKAEIRTSGLDVTDVDIEPSCVLSLSKTIGGKALIVLQYKYDNIIFTDDDKRQAAVMLREIGDVVRLIRTKRNFYYEESLRNCMLWIDNEWQMSKNFRPAAQRLFNTMNEAVMWISSHEKAIKKHRKYEVSLNTSKRYCIQSFNIRKSKTWLGDWLNIRIALILGDGTKIPFSFFRDAVIHGQDEVELPNGEVFCIPVEWYSTYGGLLMMASVNGDYLKIHRSQLSAVNHQLYNIEEDKDAVVSEVVDDVIPKELHATLRSYQEEGFKWLLKNLEAHTGCCLADDMGLGKTIQTITLLLKYKEICKNGGQGLVPQRKVDSSGMMDMFSDFFDDETSSSRNHDFKTSLIVCPSSLVFNWYNELKRFAPNLTVCRYTGTINERKKKLDALGAWDVVLTSYRTAANDIDELTSLSYGIVVFDESQVFKNRSSQVYAAMLRLKADYRMALSGTPMENSLPELWSLMNVLNPLLLGDYKTFQHNFTTPINENLEDVRTKILRDTIAPYFLRRTKEQVLTDLPERQDELIYCEMTDEQRHIYDEELSMARNLVAAGTTDDFSVLAAIGRMRQAANHPQLIGRAGADIALSGKTATVFEHLESLRGTKHKVLLFSEYVSFLNLIADEMNRRGWAYEMLTGETQNRERVIKHFSSDDDCQFFLVSLKAGGVGLNLTCADYVFILNPWWNKAAEEQAISRAHRMGQQRSVFVYRFVTEATLEEKIIELQEYKQTMIEAVMPFLK